MTFKMNIHNDRQKSKHFLEVELSQFVNTMERWRSTQIDKQYFDIKQQNLQCST